ncbi:MULTISPECIES: hypothetical protein [unclassified Mycobacterium]|uniref:hypothetical protein n=1 Tax=unclassified Mycobacterium TaxID=2642494 RepID=UPI00073FF66C|nr:MULTISPECIES: hypothetical protein [unclassified Mycobacterium]KUH82727.1 hypothetical protein AU186_18780 [Mycobacterium sp. GA-1999]KUH88004.1 hypothetical protein AU185_08455 [Mycobacterium sp. GA-0227b]KUH96025.1 hypothetical protein AU187_12285 [Mycobacterium sp. IS-1556]
MNSSHQPKPRSSIVVVLAAAFALVCASAAPTAQAFQIQNHDRITRDALAPLGVDEATMGQILVGPPPGAGVVGSDAFFADEFRHIDNAKDPADICARTQEAWNFFTPLILNGAQPAGPGGSDLVDGPGARAAFGGLAHALQDFYSHSNWVEDNIAVGQLDRMPPPLMPTCDPASLPPGLHTGFYAFGGDHHDPLGGCPPGGPPPGFVECHSTLNKDSWDTPRGMMLVPGTNPPINNYDLAARLATKATADLYWQIRNLVVSDAGECAAANLFQVERRQACW